MKGSQSLSHYHVFFLVLNPYSIPFKYTLKGSGPAPFILGLKQTPLSLGIGRTHSELCAIVGRSGVGKSPTINGIIGCGSNGTSFY